MDKIYDVAIIGGGPSGLTSAIYALRNNKSVVIIERSVFGGQITNSPSVENIPGFKEISGDVYGDLLLEQVSNLGGEFIFDECIKVNNGEIISLSFLNNEDIKTKTLIIATGTIHRSLNVENEDSLIGKKVHFCAVCDGNLYKDKIVCLIGGGNSALVEANLLADICKKLVILQDLDHFTGEEKQIKKLYSHNNIEVCFNVDEINYHILDNEFYGIKYKENGAEKITNCDGVFLAIGLVPNNQMFLDLLDLDEKGYFISDGVKTKYANIFVAGDCRKKKLRQVVTAESDGALASTLALEYLGEKR